MWRARTAYSTGCLPCITVHPVLAHEDTDLERSTAEMVEGIFRACVWSARLGRGPTIKPSAWNVRRAQPPVASGHAYYVFAQAGAGAAAAPRAAAEGLRLVTKAPAEKISRDKGPQARCGEVRSRSLGRAEPGVLLSTTRLWTRGVCQRRTGRLCAARSDGVPTYHLAWSPTMWTCASLISSAAPITFQTRHTSPALSGLGARCRCRPRAAILRPRQTRLSKRHGATSVIAYREEGIVPGAFRTSWPLLGGLRLNLDRRRFHGNSWRPAADPAVRSERPSRIPTRYSSR